MKIIITTAVIIIFTSSLTAQNYKKFYFGVNVIAPFTQTNCSKFICTWPLTAPSLSNREHGAAINVGYYYKEYQAIELRFSKGMSDHNFKNHQLHFGYNIHILQKMNKERKRKFKGLYSGLFMNMRNNEFSNLSLNTIFTYAVIGYRIDNKTNPFFIDLRLNQIFFSHSFSDAELDVHVPDNHIRGTQLFAEPPALSINIGLKF
ncbi:MAG: hypothetical protein U9N85_04020 [Bacteroidota bacterium]|nr:hypothetical protein [Bacteroidota bacterium]